MTDQYAIPMGQDYLTDLLKCSIPVGTSKIQCASIDKGTEHLPCACDLISDGSLGHTDEFSLTHSKGDAKHLRNLGADLDP